MSFTGKCPKSIEREKTDLKNIWHVCNTDNIDKKSWKKCLCERYEERGQSEKAQQEKILW